LHTIAEPEKARTFRAEYPGEEKRGAYLNDWLGRLESEGVRVGAITNHNSFDSADYKWHAQNARKRGILILPGVELNVNSGSGIHALLVFSPEWAVNTENTDYINRFLASQFPSPPGLGTRTRDNLRDCFHALEDFKMDYFVVFAHVESDNGLLPELEGSALEENIRQCGEPWISRVLGLQRVKDLARLRQRWPQDVPLPAQVEGSDPKSMAEVAAGRPCFLKLGEMSFESVRFALHDHRERVRAEVGPISRGPRLHEVRFTGGLLDGQVFPLSQQLTTLVGSRGSGKSTVIECLRYALDLPVSEADAKYKNGLISAMLANGGEVIVTGVNEHGQALTIKRPLGFPPLVRLEGSDTRLQPRSVLTGLLYFGQKDLGHRHENFESEFFAKLCGSPAAEERALEEQRAVLVRQTVGEYAAVLRAREKDDEYAQEVETLNMQLKLYQEKGVEARLQAMTSFDADKRALADFIDRVTSFRDRLSSMTAEWREVGGEFPVIRSEVLQETAEPLARLAREFASMQDDHARLLARVDGLLAELGKALQTVQEKERALQEQFAALQREINAPGLDLQQYRARRARYEQLVKLRQATANRAAVAQQTLDKAVSAARSLHELWRSWHRAELAQLEARRSSLPPLLELHSHFEGQSQAFETFLRSKLQGSGFRAASYEKVVAVFPNGLALFERRAEIESVLGGAADGPKLQAALMQHLADFLTFRVPERREIRYNGEPIQDLSLGQRATALLTLLMALESHPIVLIDQPEDDLDNETIFRRVVEPLLKRKHDAQFIIATHNPNLPVLGDAELVHACRELSKGHYTHQSGSLDSRETRENIVAIMEGGAHAFAHRQKIYRQWTNSPSAKNS